MKVISFSWVMLVTLFYLSVSIFLFFLFVLKEISGKLITGR